MMNKLYFLPKNPPYDRKKAVWIEKTHKHLPREAGENRDNVIKMLIECYDQMMKKGDASLVECVPQKNDSIYKQIVFKRLDDSRGQYLSEEDLRDIQKFIEDSIFEFDDKSIYRSVPNIINIMIQKDALCAKDFLLKSNKKLDDMAFQILKEFDQYTLEVLLIHVLSTLFNAVESTSVIRLATLIDRIDSAVRSQAIVLKTRRLYKDGATMSPEEKESINKRKDYLFGIGLVEFLQQRDLIEVSHIGNIEDEPIRKKEGHFYVAKHQNVYCKFEVSDLPIRFSLPMVCKPLDWKSTLPKNLKPKYLSQLRGGYLSSLTADIDERYRLLSSQNIDHFYLELNEDSEKLCNIMNQLQNQPFQVNSAFLAFIRENESLLVDHGLLLPSFLSKMKFKDVYEILQKKYYESNFKKGINLSNFLKELSHLMQRSSYEQYILKLAITYEGYRFYLPAFLDFRGRIYRSGILHFHERDLARSLVLFAEDEKNDSINPTSSSLLLPFSDAASFYYKAFPNPKVGRAWFIKTFLSDSIMKNNSKLIELACDAKKPLQLLSCAVVFKSSSDALDSYRAISCYPITQDASASAYQLMSYFLLDKELAKNTNLIPLKDDDNIQDFYFYILEELKVFIKDNYQKYPLILNVGENLTRKIVKGIYMPMIYGKTLMSTANDLKENFPIDLGKSHFTVAKVFYDFFEKKYVRLHCLMNMIQNIGWFSSSRDLAVCYKVPLFTTIQDYLKTTRTHIWVYDKLSNKKRKVALSIPSDERDSRKTKTSTFVNFIHQKDAFLAMSVVDSLEKFIPIYTVHDNFLSTAAYSSILPELYIKAYKQMGPPLLIINEFIYMNCCKPGSRNLPQLDRVIPSDELESLLNNCIPADQKNQNLWKKKKKMIVHSYNTYINAVCGYIKNDTTYEARYEEHEKKWYEFKQELIARYSLHY